MLSITVIKQGARVIIGGYIIIEHAAAHGYYSVLTHLGNHAPVRDSISLRKKLPYKPHHILQQIYAAKILKNYHR